jgi:hypothetical protein
MREAYAEGLRRPFYPLILSPSGACGPGTGLNSPYV